MKRRFKTFPMDGRQLQNLAMLTPEVDAGWNVSTAANRYGKARENTEGAFSVNGARRPLQRLPVRSDADEPAPV